MKALVALALLLVICCRGEDLVEGPDIALESVSGGLDLGRPSMLYIEIANRASGSMNEHAGSGDAIGIKAELLSRDDRIRVLSGQQPAGSLTPGERRTLQFQVLAEGVSPGIYPLQLRLSYSYLSSVGLETPGIAFEYRDALREIPIEARVLIGARIELEGIRGVAVAGEEAELRASFANRGESPASGLMIEAIPHPPFKSIRVEGLPESIYPGRSEEVKLSVLTEEDTEQGYYAIPCRIHYKDGGERKEEIALLVEVAGRWPPLWLLLAAGALILAGGAGVLVLSGRRRSFRRSASRTAPVPSPGSSPRLGSLPRA
ncbi:MAG: hypothetical protein QUS08_09775 [Methanothrix sp.]|nr:hypothetical protein [Methanothrix sp.]